MRQVQSVSAPAAVEEAELSLAQLNEISGVSEFAGSPEMFTAFLGLSAFWFEDVTR